MAATAQIVRPGCVPPGHRLVSAANTMVDACTHIAQCLAAMEAADDAATAGDGYKAEVKLASARMNFNRAILTLVEARF